MKIIITVLFVITCVSAQLKVQEVCKKLSKDGKITSTVLIGYQSKKEEDPKWSCAGSLINDKYILSAGYCVENRFADSLKLVKFHDGKVFNVKRTILHPGFDKRSMRHNIALMELEAPVDVALYQPACLATNPDLKHEKWFINVLRMNHQVERVEAEFVAYDVCKKEYDVSKSKIDEETQICTFEKTEKDLRPGYELYDADMKIIGVPSFGLVAPKKPQVYSKVSYYVPWIESMAWA